MSKILKIINIKKTFNLCFNRVRLETPAPRGIIDTFTFTCTTASATYSHITCHTVRQRGAKALSPYYQ